MVTISQIVFTILFFRNLDVLRSIIVELIKLKWTKIMISAQKLDKRIASQMIYEEFQSQ